jgi:hypothetical protein
MNIKTMVSKEAVNGSLTTYDIDGKLYHVAETKDGKRVVGPDYNYIFSKRDGSFARWGKNKEDDPAFSPIGPEILDIEITTICNGINGKLCPFCYKSNSPMGKNMPFETFKTILDKMDKQLTQIAFGADSQASSNPDLWKMAEYSRSIGIIPNITVANITDEVADKLVSVMGAVAVSRYADKNVCYDSIKKLTDRGLKQTNMHFCIADETYDACMETLNDIMTDARLSKLNAIVLLSLKKKGRGVKYSPLPQDKYNALVQFCLKNKINFGMDSCGAKKFLDAVKDHPKYREFMVVCEPCESTNFSEYIDVDGLFFPCSFSEGEGEWETGIDVTTCGNFLQDIWYNDKVVRFRNRLNSNCNNCHKARECPLYEV